MKTATSSQNNEAQLQELIYAINNAGKRAGFVSNAIEANKGSFASKVCQDDLNAAAAQLEKALRLCKQLIK